MFQSMLHLRWVIRLLAFHSRRNVFDPDFVSEARLCAERCARALEWKWLMQQTEQRSRFESAGMAFACLGHELRNLREEWTQMPSDLGGLRQWR